MINLSPEFRIGVPSIDREHHGLVKLLDQLIYDPSATLKSERFSDFLNSFRKQVVAHFNNEEIFFRSCGMPHEDIAAHLEAHGTILEQYAELNFDLMDDKDRAMSEVARMIKGWILVHLVEHDLKICQYVSVLEQAGVPATPNSNGLT